MCRYNVTEYFHLEFTSDTFLCYFFSFSLVIPEDAINEESEDEDKSNPDERISIRASDKRIAPENEYSDSEDEGDSRRDQRYLRFADVSSRFNTYQM